MDDVLTSSSSSSAPTLIPSPLLQVLFRLSWGNRIPFSCFSCFFVSGSDFSFLVLLCSALLRFVLWIKDFLPRTTGKPRLQTLDA